MPPLFWEDGSPIYCEWTEAGPDKTLAWACGKPATHSDDPADAWYCDEHAFTPLHGDGRCSCGAEQLWRIYFTPGLRSTALEAAKEAGMTYRFTWKDTQGYGLQAVYEHCHMSQRPASSRP